MEIIEYLITIVLSVIYLYLAFASVYIFVFSLAGIFYRKSKKEISDKKSKIAVFLPAYMEDQVILETAQHSLKQNYPQDSYKIFVIADKISAETIEKLREFPISVIEVQFENSTKAKSLNKAIESISEHFDIALVLDADNLMEANVLENVNNQFSKSIKILQLHRVAKNTNNSLAILDSISEEINNHIFRKGHRVLGFSAALIGSGMAFEYRLFTRIMAEITAVGGFDKELELRLLKDKFIIEYDNETLVYDEKVHKQSAFQNQRRRWLSAQFVYLRKNFISGIVHLFIKGNFDYFDKVLQMALPPRILQLGILVIINLFAFVAWFLNYDFLDFEFIYWLVLLVVTKVALALAIPKKMYNLKSFYAILALPKGFMMMFLSLLKIKGANKKFIHTPHGIN